MAGRIRSIKPEILEDEKTAALSHLEWRLFVSLWLVADDYGNVRGEPAYLLAQTLWASEETRDSVLDALKALVRDGLVAPYIVRGQSYLHVTGWDRHQKVDKPGKPRMPGPAEAEPEHSGTLTDDSRDRREFPLAYLDSLAPDLRPPTIDLERSGSRESLALSLAEHRSKQKRAAQLQDTWTPDTSEANRSAEAEASRRGVNPVRELEKLRDWARGKGVTRKDWNAQWRNWLRGARPEFANGSWNGARQKPPLRLTSASDEPDLSYDPNKS